MTQGRNQGGDQQAQDMPRTGRIRNPLLLLGLAFICATSLYSWITFSRLITANAWVDHTESVLSAIDAVRGTVIGAAGYERSYLITHDASFLPLYEKSRAEYPAAIAQLLNLTIDNPNQYGRVQELQRNIQQALDQMEKDIQIAESLEVESSLNAEVLAGKTALDVVRASLGALRDEEVKLYAVRRKNADEQVTAAQSTLITGTLASILLIAVVFQIMLHEARGREKAQAELKVLNARLAEDVETRTEELSTTSEDLDRTRTFLKLVIEHVPGMLFIKDAKEHKFILVNRGAEQLLGYDRSELIGKSDFDFFPPEQAEKFVDRDRKVLAAGAAAFIPDEVVTTRHNGLRHLQTKKVPVVDERGMAQFLLGFSEDITDRLQLEQQLRQVQKMDAIGQLTGGVAHDFNNLLLVILGNLEILESALGDRPALRPYVDAAIRASDRGAQLIKSLLAFARKQPLSPVRMDMNKLLRETVDMLGRTLGENIGIEMVAHSGLWACEVDPGQLQSALLNLAINARDAMPAGGKLTIETGNTRFDAEYAARHAEVTPGQYVMVAVSDTGTGIAPDILNNVFDPFFTTKEVGKGSGLGLSMVYGVVKQSKGHIKIYSEVGHGTTIRIYLPRLYDANEVDAVHPVVTGAAGGAETILVVEDDADVRQLTVTMLGSLGYRVLQAETAVEALRILGQVPFVDLLLTDVILPDKMNGRQLADQALIARPDLKVLYMSGYTENAVLHHGRLDPGVQLIQKPFRKQELAERLRMVLDARL